MNAGIETAGIEPRPKSLSSSISAFVAINAAYYTAAFGRIEATNSHAWTWNWAAAIFGPLWAAWRGLWGFFWTFMLLELFALVQIGRGLWSDLGAEQLARYEKLSGIIAQRTADAKTALAAGDQAAAQTALAIAENLKRAAADSKLAADGAHTQALAVLLAGIGLLLVVKAIEGLYANHAYERQYLRWRADPTVPHGATSLSAAFGALLLIGIWPLTIYRFTISKPMLLFTEFPIKKELFSPVANWLEAGFDWMAIEFGDVFKGITGIIRAILDGLELLLVGTPWPVVMLVIIVTAFRLAGPRVAVFVTAALAYIACFGLWESSMVTVALLGAAGFLCLLFGIPLGLWFGKSKRAYAVSLPILDFMQTMPAFVYLIPIIAFFGTGKPPGVLATIVFAMPPVIRLTALGMHQVPEGAKEAAIAFGCTRWQLLRVIEIPLAMPSIMIGINQTILMCLSMVVIASLIGAGGLGSRILEALQYAAKGQGILAGLAILFCAMIIDRIIQGMYRGQGGGER